MKKKILNSLIILGILIASTAFSQSDGSFQLRDSQWLMQLRPGMSHSAYWFLWSGGTNAITMNAQLQNPTSWITEINLNDSTSTSCSDINTLRLDILAPSTPGIYAATIIDLNSNYDPINITLLVSEELLPLDSLNLTAVVNQEILIPEPRINDGNSGLGCIDPFYPSTSQSYEFFWITDGIPGSVTTTPSEFTLLNDEQIVLENSAIFSQAGNFTAFRLAKVEFSSALWVLKVNFTVTEDVNSLNDVFNNHSSIAYPNPTIDFVNLTSSGEITIRSLDGRIIKTINSSQNALETKVDISELIPGIYFAQTGNHIYKIVKQ